MKIRPKPEFEETDRVEVDLRKDVILSFLTELINNIPGSELVVTLLLPCGAVTGRLISYADYVNALASTLHQAFGGDGLQGAEAIKAFFLDQQATIVADIKEAHTQEADVDYARPEYVHLSKGRLVSSIGMIPNDGVPMRIRLRDVSGFFIGELTRR
jgi:hypothetical protein